ncbi:MAG: acyl-CoA reductase [Bacteroidota bacterium]
MHSDKVIKAFKILGERLHKITPETKNELLDDCCNSNPWFTKSSTEAALEGIITMLSQDLKAWVNTYNFSSPRPVNVGVVLAGNIPAVGFHDLLCVLVSGNNLMAKLSDKDNRLMRFLIEQLIAIEPKLKTRIKVVDKLETIDAVIATGSDNTARYFEYYFRKYPHIIRKNRTSVGILSGAENQMDFRELAKDIFLYFGLGCRNISKLYAPNGYDLTKILAAFEDYPKLIHHHKYRNNYDYNKSIYLVNKEPHLDNGVVLFKQDQSLVSPIAVVYYDFYSSNDELEQHLSTYRSKIQCIVSKEAEWPGSIPFGQAQAPGLTDYADGVDTMQFLSKL